MPDLQSIISKIVHIQKDISTDIYMKGKCARRRQIFGHKKKIKIQKKIIEVYAMAHQPNSVKATTSQTDRDTSAISIGYNQKKNTLG